MEKFYSCLDVSKKYGIKVATVREWIKQKKLKAYKIGKSYKIKQCDLEDFEKTVVTFSDDDNMC